MFLRRKKIVSQVESQLMNECLNLSEKVTKSAQ